MDFEQFVNSGLDLKNWSPRTARTYRQAWGSDTRFQESLETSTLSEPWEDQSPHISKALLEAWVIWMRESGVTPQRCNM